MLESAARDQAAVGPYDVAIVIEGVNDAHLLPIDVWRERYEAAIASLEAKGLTVIVTTPPPRFENGGFDARYDGCGCRGPGGRRTRSAASRPRRAVARGWLPLGPPPTTPIPSIQARTAKG